MGEKGISLIEAGSEKSSNLNYFLSTYLLKCRDKSKDYFKLKFETRQFERTSQIFGKDFKKKIVKNVKNKSCAPTIFFKQSFLEGSR